MLSTEDLPLGGAADDLSCSTSSRWPRARTISHVSVDGPLLLRTRLRRRMMTSAGRCTGVPFVASFIRRWVTTCTYPGHLNAVRHKQRASRTLAYWI